MSNNKIYRAYEIEFPKELKPTYDFLQGKLLEILTHFRALLYMFFSKPRELRLTSNLAFVR